MKKLIYSAATAIVVVTSVNSCSSTNLGGYGLQAIQNMLFNASNNGFSILGNPKDFVANALIDAALPKELKDINNTLNSIGMTHLVDQEKRYIADAAQMAVATAKPIVTDAIREMTIQDAVGIATGGKGAATAYLKNKTQEKLIRAIQPQVEQKLNQVGIVNTLNTALSSSNAAGILGSILGTNENKQVNGISPISRLATEQMVNGLFNVIGNYESNQRLNPNSWTTDAKKSGW